MTYSWGLKWTNKGKAEERCSLETWRWNCKSYGSSGFLTCAYINFSKNIPILKNKEINMVDEKQRSYCFMDLQKEAYPQRFQQATETVVPLFSSHICFVLES